MPKKKEKIIETPLIEIKDDFKRPKFSHHHTNEHPYMKGLEEFNGKIIEVKDVFGDTFRGTCIGISKQHLNILMENDDGIIVIKNPQIIRREKL